MDVKQMMKDCIVITINPPLDIILVKVVGKTNRYQQCPEYAILKCESFDFFFSF